MEVRAEEGARHRRLKTQADERTMTPAEAARTTAGKRRGSRHPNQNPSGGGGRMKATD
jgi:hypothetical protein